MLEMTVIQSFLKDIIKSESTVLPVIVAARTLTQIDIIVQ